MKKFIVSDLHGNGEVYNSIIGYLENVSLVDDIELYINGDLIDRGPDSYRMLEDVVDRIKNKKGFPIHYLAGNHELMMYQALFVRKPNKGIDQFCDWMSNGGWIIESELDSLENGEEKIAEFLEFLSELDVYHKFEEKIQGNNILLVHAQAPSEVLDVCDMKIKDNNRKVKRAVWTRERDKFFSKNKIGKEGYFTIIGHTPVFNENGFIYNVDDNYINIDGGCAAYALGQFDYDHVPLLEIEDGRISILVFNHNNEIIDGYYVDGEIHKMKYRDLELRRAFINSSYDNCREKGIELIKNNH